MLCCRRRKNYNVTQVSSNPTRIKSSTIPSLPTKAKPSLSSDSENEEIQVRNHEPVSVSVINKDEEAIVTQTETVKHDTPLKMEDIKTDAASPVLIQQTKNEVPKIEDVEEPKTDPVQDLPDKLQEKKTQPNKVVIIEPTQRETKIDSAEDMHDEVQEIAARREGFQGRTVNINEKIITYEKTKEAREQILNAFNNNEFLPNILKENQIQEMIDAMQPKVVKANEIILKQGDIGDYMFISESGRFEIIIDDNLYDTFADQRVFGELAILYNNPRLATIKATTDGHAWMLHRNVFQSLTILKAMAEDEAQIEFLRKVPIIHKASDTKLQKISNLFKEEFFKTNTNIVKQGDKGDKFYIIKAGTATVHVEGEGNVATLQKGQFFGERALLQDDCRQATVIANSPGVNCLYLSRQDFTDNLGDLEEFMGKVDVEPPIISGEIKSEYDHIELNELTRKGTLGIGGFGRVELVQSKTDKKLVFALKYLRKVYIVETGQLEHSYNEKKIQISCKTDFIVRLYKTYQDKVFLYFLMEPCLGGDLFTLIQKQKGRFFPEYATKFYAACILEALSYLHSRDFVYRDLKPENMMIDSQGYLKLTDFGFAKHLVSGKKAFTFAGTPEYVAPEIIYNRGHDKGVDCWAFGIFIFEMLAGRTPFKSSDPTHLKTYNLILKGLENIVFPSKIPPKAQNIIKKLCRPLPKDRLGCQRNGMDDVANHKWFSDLDFKKLRSRKLSSPHVPKLKNNTDLTHFDHFPEDHDSKIEHKEALWDGF